MKKTLHINISGFPFIIDEDAYHLLKEYFDAIGKVFASMDDGRSIADDIETRVAELLLEKKEKGKKIIDINDIESIISQIGKPEEIIEYDETSTFTNGNEDRTTEEVISPPPYNPHSESFAPVKKKLYRDPQNALLGGVCSGFAWYLNMDPTIVRLVTVLLTLLSATTCGIVYVILWVVVPEAQTPLERLQMKGEQPTVENIGKSVMNEYAPGYYVNQNTGFWSFITKCLAIFAKIAIVFFILILALVLIGLIVGILATAIVYFNNGGNFNGGNNIFKEIEGGVLLFYLIIGIFGIVALLVIPFLLFKNRNNKEASNQRKRNTMIGFLIIGLILTWMAGINIARWFKERPQRLKHYTETMKMINEENTEIIEENELEKLELTIDSIINDNKSSNSSIEIIKENVSDSVKVTIGIEKSKNKD